MASPMSALMMTRLPPFEVPARLCVATRMGRAVCSRSERNAAASASSGVAGFASALGITNSLRLRTSAFGTLTLT